MEWWIGRLCEEFHCLPSQAWEEWQTAPHGLLETILTLRSYARAKQAVDQTKDLAQITKMARASPMVQQVLDTEADLVRDAMGRG